MSITILATDNKNNDFINLIELLDEDLNERNGVSQKQYDKYNKTDNLKNVVVAFIDEIPVACGALKEQKYDTIELKRIFVKKEYRRQGLAKIIIHELENLGRKQGYAYAVLETGINQQEAIWLYKSLGYIDTQNFEPYIGCEHSICMKKEL